MEQAEARQAKGRMTRGRKVLVAVAGGLLALAAGLVAVCWFVGIRSMADVASYRAMRREGFHPVWKDLALGRFRRGSDVESLVGRHEASQREEAGVYTRLVYGEGDEHGCVTVVARDGRLTAAVADTSAGRHVFFYDLERMQEFGQAHKEHTEQKQTEMDVVRLDRAVREGRDIFLGRCLLCDGKPYPSPERRALTEELRSVYGGDRFPAQMITMEELTVEVVKVLSGNLEPGVRLTFSGEECRRFHLDEGETLFVSVKDEEISDGGREGGRRYRSVSKGAWELYRSLTARGAKGR